VTNLTSTPKEGVGHDYIKALGQDFSDAMNLEESLDPNSADGKAYNDAVNALDAKCTK